MTSYKLRIYLLISHSPLLPSPTSSSSHSLFFPFSLFIPLPSLHLCLSLSLSVTHCLSLSLPVSASLPLCVFLSVTHCVCVSMSVSLPLCLSHMHHPHSDPYSPWHLFSLFPHLCSQPWRHLLVSPLPLPAFIISGSPSSLSSLCFQGLFLQLCLRFSLFFSNVLISFPALPHAPQVPVSQALSTPHSCGSPLPLLSLGLLCSQRGEGIPVRGNMYHLCYELRC